MILFAIFAFIFGFARGTNIGNYLACLNDTTCGIAHIRPHDRPNGVISYIVGGLEAVPHSWPWMVALNYRGGFLCGGSLIRLCTGEIVVLTTAQCVDGRAESTLSVDVGAHSRSAHEPGQNTHFVSEIIKHKDFLPYNHSNDIAVLKLTQPVTLNTTVSPICVTSLSTSYYYNKHCVVTGWGTASDGAPLDKLHEVYKPVVSHDQCTQLLNTADRKPFDETQMMCAGGDGKGVCQGDSGAPLACYSSETNQYDLIGIVSWGYGCAIQGTPEVYTDVHKYLQWISSIP